MAIDLISNNHTYNLIKKGIEASTTRAEVISNNMANINTANYKKFKVVFEENLNSEVGGSLSLKKTKEKHISDGGEYGEISVVQDESTSMRTDGNNVDLDIEKVNQAANTMKYYALIQSANGKLANVKNVITGGN